ncbi:MAG: hypothetical protein M3319_07915, partial [Actinomycetota bacterium]|nr:hypothetical protein [Actinomycetota bacterium]
GGDDPVSRALAGPQQRRASPGVPCPRSGAPAWAAEDGGAPLLEIIVPDAPPGAVIEVNTVGMQALAERMLAEGGRQDVTVALRPPRERAPAQTAGSPERPAERP